MQSNADRVGTASSNGHGEHDDDEVQAPENATSAIGTVVGLPVQVASSVGRFALGALTTIVRGGRS